MMNSALAASAKKQPNNSWESAVNAARAFLRVQKDTEEDSFLKSALYVKRDKAGNVKPSDFQDVLGKFRTKEGRKELASQINSFKRAQGNTKSAFAPEDKPSAQDQFLDKLKQAQGGSPNLPEALKGGPGTAKQAGYEQGPVRESVVETAMKTPYTVPYEMNKLRQELGLDPKGEFDFQVKAVLSAMASEGGLNDKDLKLIRELIKGKRITEVYEQLKARNAKARDEREPVDSINPESWENRVKTARKELNIEEGSESDQFLKSALWLMNYADETGDEYVRDEDYKATVAKLQTEDGIRELAEDIQAYRQRKTDEEARGPLPTIQQSTPEMIKQGNYQKFLRESGLKRQFERIEDTSQMLSETGFSQGLGNTMRFLTQNSLPDLISGGRFSQLMGDIGQGALGETVVAIPRLATNLQKVSAMIGMGIDGNNPLDNQETVKQAGYAVAEILADALAIAGIYEAPMVWNKAGKGAKDLLIDTLKKKGVKNADEVVEVINNIPAEQVEQAVDSVVIDAEIVDGKIRAIKKKPETVGQQPELPSIPGRAPDLSTPNIDAQGRRALPGNVDDSVGTKVGAFDPNDTVDDFLDMYEDATRTIGRSLTPQEVKSIFDDATGGLDDFEIEEVRKMLGEDEGIQVEGITDKVPRSKEDIMEDIKTQITNFENASGRQAGAADIEKIFQRLGAGMSEADLLSMKNRLRGFHPAIDWMDDFPAEGYPARNIDGETVDLAGQMMERKANEIEDDWMDFYKESKLDKGYSVEGNEIEIDNPGALLQDYFEIQTAGMTMDERQALKDIMMERGTPFSSEIDLNAIRQKELNFPARKNAFEKLVTQNKPVNASFDSVTKGLNPDDVEDFRRFIQKDGGVGTNMVRPKVDAADFAGLEGPELMDALYEKLDSTLDWDTVSQDVLKYEKEVLRQRRAQRRQPGKQGGYFNAPNGEDLKYLAEKVMLMFNQLKKPIGEVINMVARIYNLPSVTIKDVANKVLDFILKPFDVAIDIGEAGYTGFKNLARQVAKEVGLTDITPEEIKNMMRADGLDIPEHNLMKPGPADSIRDKFTDRINYFGTHPELRKYLQGLLLDFDNTMARRGDLINSLDNPDAYREAVAMINGLPDGKYKAMWYGVLDNMQLPDELVKIQEQIDNLDRILDEFEREREMYEKAFRKVHESMRGSVLGSSAPDTSMEEFIDSARAYIKEMKDKRGGPPKNTGALFPQKPRRVRAANTGAGGGGGGNPGDDLGFQFRQGDNPPPNEGPGGGGGNIPPERPAPGWADDFSDNRKNEMARAKALVEDILGEEDITRPRRELTPEEIRDLGNYTSTIRSELDKAFKDYYNALPEDLTTLTDGPARPSVGDLIKDLNQADRALSRAGNQGAVVTPRRGTGRNLETGDLLSSFDSSGREVSFEEYAYDIVTNMADIPEARRAKILKALGDLRDKKIALENASLTGANADNVLSSYSELDRIRIAREMLNEGKTPEFARQFLESDGRLLLGENLFRTLSQLPNDKNFAAKVKDALKVRENEIYQGLKDTVVEINMSSGKQKTSTYKKTADEIIKEAIYQKGELDKIVRDVKFRRAYDNQKALGKVWTNIKQGLGASKTLLLSGEAGFLGRQAWRPMMTRPMLLWKTGANTLKAGNPFGGQQWFDNYMNELKKDVRYRPALEAGLEITDPTNISRREEDFLTDMFERWTVNRWQDSDSAAKGAVGNAGRVVGDLLGKWANLNERAYTAALNTVRFDTFNEIAAANENWARTNGKTLSQADYESFARTVNMMTGRARIDGVDPEVIKTLNELVISARYYLSQIQFLTGGEMTTVRNTATARGRLAAVKEYGKYVGAVTAVVSMATMLGGKVETDPKGTDFLRIRFGEDSRIPQLENVSIELDAGSRGFANLGTRGAISGYNLAAGLFEQPLKDNFKSKAGNESNRDFTEIVGEFVAGRSNIAPRLLLNSKDIAEGEYFGRETNIGREAIRGGLPIQYVSAWDNRQDINDAKITEEQLRNAFWLNFLGLGGDIQEGPYTPEQQKEIARIQREKIKAKANKEREKNKANAERERERLREEANRNRAEARNR